MLKATLLAANDQRKHSVHRNKMVIASSYDVDASSLQLPITAGAPSFRLSGGLVMAGYAARVESVALTDADARWVDAQVASGRYPNASAVLADAVRTRRQDDEEEAALDAELGALIAEAAQEDATGGPIECRTRDDFDRAFGHLRTDASTR